MMKFDVFCEIQRAFPWEGKDEASLFREILDRKLRERAPDPSHALGDPLLVLD